MSAPDRDAALRALDAVRKLDGKSLDARIEEEIGDEMLGVIAGLAESVSPTQSRDERRRTIHAMVLAYLMRGEIDEGD